MSISRSWARLAPSGGRKYGCSLAGFVGLYFLMLKPKVK